MTASIQCDVVPEPSKPGPGRYSGRDRKRIAWICSVYDWITLPFLTAFLLHNRRFDPEYGLTWRRKIRLARHMHRNTRTIETGTSFRAHLAMAAKIFEIPKSTKGVLVECGCWKGGTSTNLSLVADAVDRTLIVYDSFEGLPPPADGDRWAHGMATGAFRGDLEVVQANVQKGGVIERCQFRKGWFSDTLPSHGEPIVAAYIDVDYQQSLHQCVLHLWPHLTRRGYVFIDEFTRLDYCALFFSEQWWRSYFDRPPPGLMGAGTGVAVGHHFVGPQRDMPPIQSPQSFGYTRKDFYGMWDYVADETPTVRDGGGTGSVDGADGWTPTSVSMAERFERRRQRRARDASK